MEERNKSWYCLQLKNIGKDESERKKFYVKNSPSANNRRRWKEQQWNPKVLLIGFSFFITFCYRQALWVGLKRAFLTQYVCCFFMLLFHFVPINPLKLFLFFRVQVPEAGNNLQSHHHAACGWLGRSEKHSRTRLDTPSDSPSQVNITSSTADSSQWDVERWWRSMTNDAVD